MVKNIVVDISALRFISGLGMVAKNYYKELVKQKPENWNLYFIIHNKNDINLIPLTTKAKVLSYAQIKWGRFGFKKIHLWHSLDQVHCLKPFKNIPAILTIHDLNPIIELGESKAQEHLHKLQNKLSYYHHILTDSFFSKKMITTYLNLSDKSLDVVYCGVEEHRENLEISSAYSYSKPFFFTIGEVLAKKNFHVLLPLMKHFPNYKLYIAGNDKPYDLEYVTFLKKEIKKQNLTQQVFLLGIISSEEKYWFYNHCSAFLFPSYAEGFGLPIIEAMKAGKPIIASNQCSIPEIGLDKIYYFENYEEKYMVSIIKDKLAEFNKNSSSRSQEIKDYAQKFSWSESVKEHLMIYDKIIASA